MDCKFCAAVKNWAKRPFKEDGTIFDWFLFVGLLAAISWLWTRIINRIV